MNDDEKALSSVASQMMAADDVILAGQKIKVRRVGSGRLRLVEFQLNGRVYEAIEQNPQKPSRWGQLAREKHQVVQFRDVATRKYVAVSVDGNVHRYARD